jgi:alkanesulfonate monooxygenase SsuD/methylene tetrahydromethanopterin reductase-like flavin-dependent oxidoreductase (luciferase family)
MRNHGTEPSQRFRVMRERIEAMKAIWTGEEASYAGRYVNFERIWCWPKPLQQPHPPVLVGGTGPRVLARVMAYGDEWMPNRLADDELLARVSELNERAEELARPRVPVTVAGLVRDARRIERLARGGVDRGFFWLPPRGRAEVEEALDSCARLVGELQQAGA